MSPETYVPRGEGAIHENYLEELLKGSEGKIFVVGFNGSNQQEAGRTRELLERALKTIDNSGGSSVIIDLARVKMDIPSGTYGKSGLEYTPEKRTDDVEDIRWLLRKSDAIIIATPVYWFSHSSLIQRLLEHLTVLEDYGELEGKVAGIIVTEQEEGASSVIGRLMFTLTQFGMIIVPYSGVFSRGPGKDLAWVGQDIRDLGPRIINMVRATNNIDWDNPSSQNK